MTFSTNHSIEFAEQLEQAESDFLALLSEDKKALYESLAIPKLFPDRLNNECTGLPQFDVKFAERWIAKRAYGFGWTKKLFPNELGTGIDRQRPTVERIGKKYQRLAFSEFLASLTDNVWLKSGWEEQSFRYGYACEIDFVRDIEPTILSPSNNENTNSTSNEWWLPNHIKFRPESNGDVAKWPFETRDLHNSSEQIDVVDPDGKNWLVLKSFYHADERFEDDKLMVPFRRSAFFRVSAIIVKMKESDSITENLTNVKLTDPTDWEHADVTDGPFWLEFPWRITWDSIFDSWEIAEIGKLAGTRFVRPLMNHVWESHLDLSLPEGAMSVMPSSWLASKLALQPTPFEHGRFRNASGEVIFMDPGAGKGGSHAGLIDRDGFLALLAQHELECLWVVAGEKSACPTGSREQWGCRYHSAIYRRRGEKWIGSPWFEDRRRGLIGYGPTLTDI